MDPTARLFRLLSLLRREREWNAECLGYELNVTPRTVRRDVGRLRELGYQVATTRGPGGGYALEADGALPLSVFDTDEMVAVLLALRFAAAAGGDVVDETGQTLRDAADSAADKLHRLLPASSRRIIDSLLAHTSSVDLGEIVTDRTRAAPVAELVLLTAACRDRRRVTCRATAAAPPGERTLEPLHLVHTMAHWFLHAYCLVSHAWITVRVDELADLRSTQEPSTHRPPEDVRERVTDDVKARVRQVTGRVRVAAPADRVQPWVAPAWGRVVTESATTCVVDAGADTHDAMARWLLLLDAELTVLEPPELAAAFARLAARAHRASLPGPRSREPAR